LKIASGLLVGAGSVGKRHAKVLERTCEQVVVVDGDPGVEKWVADQLGQHATFNANLESAVKTLKDSSDQCVAIVATLGPSHHEIVEQLLNLGIRNIYCEKPLATSIAECRSLVQQAEQVGARVTVGLQRRFTGLAREIRRAGEAHLGGLPTSVIAHGGAQCLITTGTHWLDLVCDLFGTTPTRVSALLSAEKINPRGATLDMWQGGATWMFDGDRTLTMSYNNKSSADGQVQVYFPLGRIDVNSDGTILMYGRNIEEVARDARITRVGDLVERGPMDTTGLTADPVAVALQELVGSGELTYTLRTAAAVAEAALGALIASHEGRTVDLPIPDDHPLVSRQWAVT